MNEKFLRTDVGPHFLDSISQFEILLDWASNDNRAWPWVIISTVQVVQSACVLFLDERESVSSACLTKRSSKELWHALNGSLEDFPKKRFLKHPKELLNSAITKLQTPISKRHEDAFSDVVFLRNKYMHFVPQGHSLLLDGVPVSVGLSIDIAFKLVKEPGTYASLRLPDSERDSAKEWLAALSQQAFNLQENYT